MARVSVDIEEITLVDDSGRSVASVCATCDECGHQTQSYGTGDGSRRRCLALMREECPEESSNFYVDSSGE